MSTPNPTILSPNVGYITKDQLWAAVSYGSKFMVLNNGEQGPVFATLTNAKAFIAKKTKTSTGVSAPKKPKKSKNPSEGTLAPFLK